MGGDGSGWWGKRSRKVLVEETQRLKISNFHELINKYPEKQVAIKFGKRFPLLVLGNLRFSDGEPILILRYIPRSYGEEMVELETEIVKGNNGLKCYFRCPLRLDDCLDRVSILHLPYQTQHFGCRKCHDLTYRSSRTAHSTERMAKKLRGLMKMGDVQKSCWFAATDGSKPAE